MYNEADHPRFFKLFDKLRDGDEPKHSGVWLRPNKSVTFRRFDAGGGLSKLMVRLHDTDIAQIFVRRGYPREVYKIIVAYGGWYTPTTNRWLAYALDEFGVRVSCPLRKLPSGLAIPIHTPCSHVPDTITENPMYTSSMGYTQYYRTIKVSHGGERGEFFASRDCTVTVDMSDHGRAIIHGGKTQQVAVYKPIRGHKGFYTIRSAALAYLKSAATDDMAGGFRDFVRRQHGWGVATTAEGLRTLYQRAIAGDATVEELAVRAPAVASTLNGEQQLLTLTLPITHVKLFETYGSVEDTNNFIAELGYGKRD